MITIYVYSKETLLFLYTDTGSSIDNIVEDIDANNDFTLVAPPDYERIWKWENIKWVELLPINNPNIFPGPGHIWDEKQNKWIISPEFNDYKILKERELIWELIKERRLQAVTSGVYVESADKWFHTDEVSVTSYSTIAGMIALDNYEPVQWKTMDNTWILLTIPIFKELQTAMSQKTNANYAIAEQHKSNMMKSDNPVEYDFSTSWV